MPKEDPAQPEFWERRFREGVTPWDAGGVPPRLQDFLAAEPAAQRVLIPGCGSGYEIRAFIDAGWSVLAVDYAEAAVERARALLGPHAGCVRRADFFSFDPGSPFDLVYERAFLCALPRSLWDSYAPRVAEMLAPAGRLAGFFFFDEADRGPPFGLKPGEIQRLLDGRFHREADEAVRQSVPVFAGKERWQVWRRAR